ncbi:MAG: hypothetical protein ACYCOR_13740 [Acidobacteriaceae bacterium]
MAVEKDSIPDDQRISRAVGDQIGFEVGALFRRKRRDKCAELGIDLDHKYILISSMPPNKASQQIAVSRQITHNPPQSLRRS